MYFYGSHNNSFYGFVNSWFLSNAFKKFYKYGLKIETYIPITLTLKKIQVKKVNSQCKMDFTMLATSNVTIFKKMFMDFFLLVDLKDMFKIFWGSYFVGSIILKMKKSSRKRSFIFLRMKMKTSKLTKSFLYLN